MARSRRMSRRAGEGLLPVTERTEERSQSVTLLTDAHTATFVVLVASLSSEFLYTLGAVPRIVRSSGD